MGNYEDKNRDNKTDKPTSGQPGQHQGDRNKPASQNEPGRESNVPRQGQGPGGTGTSGSGRSKSENDEESA